MAENARQLLAEDAARIERLQARVRELERAIERYVTTTQTARDEDGQPVQDWAGEFERLRATLSQPETCPTCGSHDPAKRESLPLDGYRECPDSFHQGGQSKLSERGDTELEGGAG